MSQVFVKAYPDPPVNRREVLRYAGVRAATPEVDALVDGCLAKLKGSLHCRVCWAMYPVALHGERVDLGFAETVSQSLRTHLQGCSQLVLFAATVGVEVDRIAARAAYRSAAQGHMLHAIGAERVESLCDAFCADICAGFDTRARFSPGYGDLPLSLQKDIFRALDCGRSIGLSLSENLLMTPSKSVTAIIGVKGETA